MARSKVNFTLTCIATFIELFVYPPGHLFCIAKLEGSAVTRSSVTTVRATVNEGTVTCMHRALLCCRPLNATKVLSKAHAMWRSICKSQIKLDVETMNRAQVDWAWAKHGCCFLSFFLFFFNYRTVSCFVFVLLFLFFVFGLFSQVFLKSDSLVFQFSFYCVPVSLSVCWLYFKFHGFVCMMYVYTFKSGVNVLRSLRVFVSYSCIEWPVERHYSVCKCLK